jgi:hypothetical protein
MAAILFRRSFVAHAYSIDGTAWNVRVGKTGKRAPRPAKAVNFA